MFRVQSALDYQPSKLVAVLNEAFTDYFTPVNVTAIALAEKIRSDSLDLDASRVCLRDNQLVGIALMARRGKSARLASMGIVPQFRRQGLGRHMLDELLTEERRRNTQDISLEVITQNTSAIKLYQQAGFTTARRLVGFTSGCQSGSSDALQIVNVQEVGIAMIQWATNNLAWQVSGETIVQLGPPTQGFRFGDAWAAVTPGQKSEMFLRCIVVRPESRRQGHATRLIRALFGRFPDATWTVSSLVPEGVGDLFRKVGFDDHPISQMQMLLRLDKQLPNTAKVTKRMLLDT